MAVKTKVSAYSQQFKVLVDQTLSPKARNDMIAAAARRQINAADQINRSALGAVPPTKLLVTTKLLPEVLLIRIPL